MSTLTQKVFFLPSLVYISTLTTNLLETLKNCHQFTCPVYGLGSDTLLEIGCK